MVLRMWRNWRNHVELARLRAWASAEPDDWTRLRSAQRAVAAPDLGGHCDESLARELTEVRRVVAQRGE